MSKVYVVMVQIGHGEPEIDCIFKHPIEEPPEFLVELLQEKVSEASLGNSDAIEVPRLSAWVETHTVLDQKD